MGDPPGVCLPADKYFSGGCPPAGPTVRDESQKQRTCVAAKAALFSSLSDELRRVIGNMPILEKFSNSEGHGKSSQTLIIRK